MSPDDTDSGRSRRTVLRTAGAATGLSLLAGGPLVGAADAVQEEGEARVAMITVQDLEAFEFDAPLLWVDAGTDVTWVNESGSHSSTAYAPENDKPGRVPEGAAAWDSGVLSEQGATFTHTFDTDGVYDYYCTPHEGLGMVARLVVGAPDFGAQPALDPPQDDIPSGAADVIEALNTLTRTMFGLEQG